MQQKNKNRVKSLILFSPVFVSSKGASNQILKRIGFVDKISENSRMHSITSRALGYRQMSQYVPLIRSVKNGVQHLNTPKIMNELANFPITILYGDRDSLIDKKYLKKISSKLKKTKIYELNNVGHNFPFFNPQLAIEHLAGFQQISKPMKKASAIPKSFLHHLAKLAAPILIIKSLFYIGVGLLLFTNFAAWVVTLGLSIYVFKYGYSSVRGAFSLKNENLSYIGYILLGAAGIFLSFFLFHQPELAIKISIIVVCCLILLSGLSKLLVGLVWTHQKHLRNQLVTKGYLMTLIGLTALAGSFASIQLIVYIFAVIAILRGLQFGVYAWGAFGLAYIRGF